MQMQNTNNTCKLCRIKIAKYSCPRCNIIYCSVPCYQSPDHLDCSEEFYKSCIKEELEDGNDASKQKMLEILQRQHEDSLLETNNDLDSDDDDEVEDIANRLAGVDLDNADQVWEKLTSDEQQEFLAFLKTKDVTNLIPRWEPWWLYSSKCVEEVATSNNYKNNCPDLIKIRDFQFISAKPPADCVKYNLCNILASYVFTTRYFNGEHHDFYKEAASCLINLSSSLKNNENFNDYETATKSVILQILNCDWISADEENFNLIQDDLKKILKGPALYEKKYYILSALSDLYNVLNNSLKDTDNGSSFNKKILNDHFPDCKIVTKDKIKLCLKKINYFLSYTKDCLKLDSLI